MQGMSTASAILIGVLALTRPAADATIVPADLREFSGEPQRSSVSTCRKWTDTRKVAARSTAVDGSVPSGG